MTEQQTAQPQNTTENPIYIKLAMGNMVRKSGKSLKHGCSYITH